MKIAPDWWGPPDPNWWHGTFDNTHISEVNVHGRASAGDFARSELAKWIRQWPGWSKKAKASISKAGPSLHELEIVKLKQEIARLKAITIRQRKRKGRAMWLDDIGRYKPEKTVVYQASWTGAECWLETMKYCEEGP